MVDKNKVFVNDGIRLGTNSPEREFLLYCSRISIDDEIKEKLKTMSESGLDWPRLISKASRHGVAQFLYLHLSKLDEIWSVIPEKLKDKLKQYYYKIQARNWLLQQELNKVISLLNQSSVQVIVLKGASLLESVYKNIALRPMSDVDLLVERKNLSRAKSILQDMGYHKPNFLDHESLEKFGGEIHLYREGGVFLDIHASLYQYERFRNIFKIDLDGELWSKSRMLATREGEIRILNPTYLIMHLCMHHAIAHSFVGLFRFCDLREAILAYQQDINWQDLVSKASKYKIKKIVYYNLVLMQDLFGPVVTEDILESLKSNKTQEIIISKREVLSLPDKEPRLKKTIYQLFLMDKFLDIPQIALKGLFPSNEWLRYKYGIKKNVELIFYRLFHPLITAFKLLS